MEKCNYVGTETSHGMSGKFHVHPQHSQWVEHDSAAGGKPCYNTKIYYNSGVCPATIEASLARKNKKYRVDKSSPRNVKGRIFWATGGMSDRGAASSTVEKNEAEKGATKQRSVHDGVNVKTNTSTANVEAGVVCQNKSTCNLNEDVLYSIKQSSAKAANSGLADDKDTNNEFCPIYDIKWSGADDKFVSAIMHVSCRNQKPDFDSIDTPIFQKWREQGGFQFGFVPLQELIMPECHEINDCSHLSLLQIHNIVKSTGRSNFLQACVPVNSQLKIEAWEQELTEYWYQQLLELIKFGFPLDLNRDCHLDCKFSGNHSSANGFPQDIEAYITEELSHGAILGPFEHNPIENGHTSPFMTRHKPNSERQRVIVDLSWPQGVSVNTGFDKMLYLESEFYLTFSTVDDDHV